MKKEKIVPIAVVVLFSSMLLVSYFSPAMDVILYNLLSSLLAYVFIGMSFFCAYLLYKK